MSSVLYDEMGPRGRRAVAIGSVTGSVILAGIVYVIYRQMDSRGQFNPAIWSVLQNPDLVQLLIRGLLATLKVAFVSMILSLTVGVFIAVARMSRFNSISLPTAAIIEILRGIPLLLIIFSVYLGAPALGLEVSVFWALVIGLTAYNSVIIGEILRAGINALPQGQAEAGAAIGLTSTQILTSILLPQAVSRMLPVMISQLVIVLKETSLGFIIGYTELLRNGRTAVEYLGGQYSIPIYTTIAAVYILINVTLSLIATRMERRSSHP